MENNNSMRKRSIFRKSVWDVLRGFIVPVLFTVAVMGMIIYGLRQTEEASRAEGLRVLEDSIRRAVITAYAIDGRYPGSIEDIVGQFGINIDETRFVVHYRIFASNIMPDITVLEI